MKSGRSSDKLSRLQSALTSWQSGFTTEARQEYAAEVSRRIMTFAAQEEEGSPLPDLDLTDITQSRTVNRDGIAMPYNHLIEPGEKISSIAAMMFPSSEILGILLEGRSYNDHLLIRVEDEFATQIPSSIVELSLTSGVPLLFSSQIRRIVPINRELTEYETQRINPRSVVIANGEVSDHIFIDPALLFEMAVVNDRDTSHQPDSFSKKPFSKDRKETSKKGNQYSKGSLDQRSETHFFQDPFDSAEEEHNSEELETSEERQRIWEEAKEKWEKTQEKLKASEERWKDPKKLQKAAKKKKEENENVWKETKKQYKATPQQEESHMEWRRNLDDNDITKTWWEKRKGAPEEQQSQLPSPPPGVLKYVHETQIYSAPANYKPNTSGTPTPRKTQAQIAQEERDYLNNLKKQSLNRTPEQTTSETKTPYIPEEIDRNWRPPSIPWPPKEPEGVLRKFFNKIFTKTSQPSAPARKDENYDPHYDVVKDIRLTPTYNPKSLSTREVRAGRSWRGEIDNTGEEGISSPAAAPRASSAPSPNTVTSAPSPTISPTSVANNPQNNQHNGGPTL